MLTDGDVAELARAVVDRIDPDLDIRIEPSDPVDPYRMEVSAWTVHVAGASSYLTASMTKQDALDKLTGDLGAGADRT